MTSDRAYRAALTHAAAVAELRRVSGTELDPDEGTQNAMREIFAPDRFVACLSKDLPKKLGAMLEAIRGV